MWFFPGPLGMNDMLPAMQSLPFPHVFFRNLVWPGIFLLLIIGATQLTSALLIWQRRRLAPLATLACGLILMGWISIQFAIFEANPLSPSYFAFGLIQAVMAALWLRRQDRPS